MKKDEIRLKKRLDKYTLKSSELIEGMYVGRINFKAGRIDNKYLVVGKRIIDNGDDFVRGITCYDFIENKLVDFKPPIFSFLRGSEDNNDFYYKFKYSTLDEYKKLNIGDEVVFISPENIKTRPTPLFKIVKKQIKQGDDGRFDLMDGNGYVLHNIPGILLEEFNFMKEVIYNKFKDVKGGLLKQLFDTVADENRIKYIEIPGDAMRQQFEKEDTAEENKKERPTYSIRSMKSKTPTKLKFTIDIDYANDAPIKIKLKKEDSSYSKDVSIFTSIDKKNKLSNILKNISFRDIFEKYIESENDEVKLISGKSKYWRFIPFNFKCIESRLYDEFDLTCQIDIKSGNLFKSKMDLLKSDTEEVKKIKENLAKYILEH